MSGTSPHQPPFSNQRGPTPEMVSPPASPPRADPEKWVNAYADVLYRHAVIRVRDPQLAEDLVQETFLAAWKNRDGYRGGSSEKTWLFAILKNKMMDHYRKLAREISFTDPRSLSSLEDRTFQREGYHKNAWTECERPKPWMNAEESLSRREFWNVLQSCLDKLPRPLARAFLLREVDAVETKDVCRTLHVSPNHLWVMLHRARLGLRGCLQKHWFQDDPPSASPPPAS